MKLVGKKLTAEILIRLYQEQADLGLQFDLIYLYEYLNLVSYLSWVAIFKLYHVEGRISYSNGSHPDHTVH